MNYLAADLRSGVRMLVKYPTLSLVAVLTLGLGHRPQHDGLLRRQRRPVQGPAVPGRRPHRGARRDQPVAERSRSSRSASRTCAVWQARQTSFEKIGAYGFAPMNLSTEEGRPERFSGGQLTRRGLRGAGRAAAPRPRVPRGRRSAWRRPGHPARARSLARSVRRLARRSSARPIRANGVQRTVIGVMPERFAFPDSARRCGCRWRSIRCAKPRGQGPELPGRSRG